MDPFDRFNSNGPSENETSRPAEIQHKGQELEFTSDMQLWRESYVEVHDIIYPDIVPEPSGFVVVLEKSLKLLAFVIWVLSVGIATVDDSLKNANIISVIISAICFQANTIFFRTDALL